MSNPLVHKARPDVSAPPSMPPARPTEEDIQLMHNSIAEAIGFLKEDNRHAEEILEKETERNNQVADTVKAITIAVCGPTVESDSLG